jgi:aminopeptidase
MVDQRTEKLAKLCVKYCVEMRPKERVLINGSELALPLMRELYKECLLADAYPRILIAPDIQYILYTYAKDHQLEYVSPFDKFLFENTDVGIGIFCDPNPRRLTNVDPAKIRMHRAARRDLAETINRLEAEGKLRSTGLPYPIDAQAQDADMDLREYENFVYDSCFVNKEDPVSEWKRIGGEQEILCKFLDKANDIRVVGEDTDLTFSVKDRKWINCCGKANMPDGEVFTAPVENSVNGTARFTYPGLFSGREVEDIRLTFKEGKVVKAFAAKGDELLQQLLKIEGGDRLGEVAIGTNYGITRFTKNMLFDEKMGGTIHMALGLNPDPDTGGTNMSTLHWDILKDMKKGGEIYADGKLFYRNGMFVET